MADFSKRSTKAEMMDDFGLDAQIIDPIMKELEVVNKLLGGYRVFYDAFDTLGLRSGYTISDWGCGGGDSLRMLADWARERKLNIKFVGVDATASALSFARQKSENYPEISYILADVLSDTLQTNQFDIVISSLFTHHFEDESWVKLIQKMNNCARIALIINDLHRHAFAYYSIGLLTRIFSRSDMVKHDSKLSVLRSFSRPDLVRLCEKAGLQNYSLKWMWAFRWQLIIKKN